jgi:hypothetical protein
MKVSELKEILAQLNDNDEICVSVDTKNYWNQTKAHPAISLLRMPVAHSKYLGADQILYDSDKIEFLEPEEVPDGKPNEHGYYDGQPVREVLVFTY